MDSAFKSTRSLLALLALILLYVVVIGSFLGYKISGEVLALVSMVISGIVTAYFGTRNQPPEGGSTTTPQMDPTDGLTALQDKYRDKPVEINQ